MYNPVSCRGSPEISVCMEGSSGLLSRVNNGRCLSLMEDAYSVFWRLSRSMRPIRSGRGYDTISRAVNLFDCIGVSLTCWTRVHVGKQWQEHKTSTHRQTKS